MIEHVKKRAATLLKSGKITGFLALKKEHGQIGPHLFQSHEQLEGLSVGDETDTEEICPDGGEIRSATEGESRYPLNKILLRIFRNYPSDCLGILVRGCDERGLKRLFSLNQLNPDKVIPVGIACSQKLADACECLQPWSEEWADENRSAKARCESVIKLDMLEIHERFDWWMEHFRKCIKCHGCRDICPMCFCKECSLQDGKLITKGEIPPEYPIFHLVRAVHMAGRCIDCGLCSQACPAGIPLRTLYKKVGNIVEQESGFRPGFSDKVYFL